MKPSKGPMSEPATRRILFASLVGTTVEFYDFYIYAATAALVFGPLFFPAPVPSTELIAASASFGIAFLARPLGGVLFGHFGDRIGRRTTLVASLVLMGASTAAIGLLPTYALAGWTAPAMLCLLRFGQGLALGGEWTGATLLALENAPPGWRARFAMFAPLGAPVGFVLANGLLLLLTLLLSAEEFRDWGWRIPFLASAPLVWLGLWVRLNLAETDEFAAALAKAHPHRAPLVELARNHLGQVAAGIFGVIACFSLYHMATAFSLGHGTAILGYPRSTFLELQLGALGFMAVAIVIAGWLSDRLDPERVLIMGCAGTILSGMALAPMLGSGSLPVVFAFLAFSLLVTGFVNGPLGAWLPGLFPPRVRYTGTSVAFNLGGIIGGFLSPMISQALVEQGGLVAVGFYLAITGGLSLIAFDHTARRRARNELEQSESRYRSIFEQTHVALCEMDFLPVEQMLALLRQQGVRDLEAHIRRQGDPLREILGQVSLIDANDAAARLLGCASRARVLGPIRHFLPTECDALLPLALAIWRRHGRSEIQTRLLAQDGKAITIILVIAFPDDPQALGRVACALIDVTERELAKEALLAAQEELARAGRISAVGAVSASIAHEVNQPIGAMVLNARTAMRWLKRDEPNIGEALKAAERAVRDGIRAGEIVQRTREQLRHRRRAESLDLNHLVEEVLLLLERDLAAASTVAVLERSEPPAMIEADRIEMQQAIINLMSNGMQAMHGAPEAGRKLVLRIESRGADLAGLSVRDHGTGIPPEHVDKLFNHFFTTRRDGMGMGLSICKTIVEAYGGSLTARNHPGGGAIFEITMPRLRHEPAQGVDDGIAAATLG